MSAPRIPWAGCFAWIVAAALLWSSSFAHAQQSTPVATGGTVTGHVICGDSQRPARFATVVLFGVPAEITPAPKPGATSDARIKDSEKAMGATSMVQSQTDVDGNFSAGGVAPGDYYVLASVPGYVQPKNILLAAYEAGADLRKPIPGITVVHVVSERPVQADLTVERGAALSGRVMWDDSSPAARVLVSIVPAKAKNQELPPQFEMISFSGSLEGLLAVTDDLGHFRIAGMLSGEYFVKGTLQTNSRIAIQKGVMNLKGMESDSPLTVFAPAAFHLADAKSVTLHTAEDRNDLELTINLSDMHTVSGRVASIEDHHGINSATVKIEAAQDKDFSRYTTVDANGNFTVTFVPPGTYNLLVTNAADAEPSRNQPAGPLKVASDATVRSYQDGTLAVIVTDSNLTGQDLELVPAKTRKEPDPDDLNQ